jgi:hypothetical protein
VVVGGLKLFAPSSSLLKDINSRTRLLVRE